MNSEGPVTVFGLSSEGYKIASSLALNGVKVTIIDENLQMGMEVKPEIARRYTSVDGLFEEEALMALHPMNESISSSKFIFFVPKVRKSPLDASGELSSRLRSVASYLSKGSTLVFCHVVGQGGSLQSLDLIEKVSGLAPGEGVNYAYAPLEPNIGKPLVVGMNGVRLDHDLLRILSLLKIKKGAYMPVELAEIQHVQDIIQQMLPMAIDSDLSRRLEPKERLRLKGRPSYREVYLDDIARYLHDLQAIEVTLQEGGLLSHVTNSILKSMDGWVKRLTEEVRRHIKEGGGRASRMEVLLAWTLDRHEMRGGRLLVSESLRRRFEDYFGQAHLQTLADKGPPFSYDKGMIVVCSKRDYDGLRSTSLAEGGPGRVPMMKANSIYEII